MSARSLLKSAPSPAMPRDQVYEDVLPQIAALIRNNDDLVSNLYGITTILDQSFGTLERNKLNVIDALYLDHVFDLLRKKYLAGGSA